jgi:hypothetical protein
MWQFPGQVNVFAVPIALVCSIETPDVLITLLSKCGKVESDFNLGEASLRSGAVCWTMGVM